MGIFSSCLNNENYDLYNDDNVIYAESLIKSYIRIYNDTEISDSTKKNCLDVILNKYDNMICTLNTTYNRHMYSTDKIFLHHQKKIITHIINLKLRHIDKKLL